MLALYTTKIPSGFASFAERCAVMAVSFGVTLSLFGAVVGGLTSGGVIA